jgi:hypothetical protein
MYINGVDIRAMGWFATGRGLPSLNLGHSYQAVAGGSPALLGERVEAATLVVTGVVIGTDRADAHARCDAILALCPPRAVVAHRVQFSDQAGREYRGRLRSAERADYNSRRWTDKAVSLTMQFSLVTPYAYPLDDTVLGLDADGTGVATAALALGIGPSPLRIVVHEPTSAVTISITDAEGYAVSTLVWEGDAAAGALVIDAATMTATQGVVRVVEEISDESIYPVADPAEGAAGVRIAGAQPGSPVTVSYTPAHAF